MNAMKVLFFGIYNKNEVTNARTRMIFEGLKRRGVDVVECNTHVASLRRFWILFKKYLKTDKDYDVMFVAYGGCQLIIPFARILTRKKIIVDPIISLYDTMIFDRKLYRKRGLRALYYYLLDWLMGCFADIIIFDTQANIDYFSKTFRSPKNKFRRLFVGTDENVMFPRPAMANKEAKNFIVHFHGFFIPLQGVEYIIQAAKILENENIIFNIIGKGQTYKKNKELAEDLKLRNINFIGSLAYVQVAEYLALADVSLGVFGNTEKTLRVIPNKVYDALAMKKAVISADTPGMRELFTDRLNCLFCRRADPADLAAKIMELKNNPDLLNEIADNGYQLFKEKASQEVLVKELMDIFDEVK